MKRQRGRNRNKGGGGNSNNPNRSFDSNGPEVRVRGNASTVYEKYVQLARDATSSGNRVRAEDLLQHAEHYLRVHTEQQAKAQAAREEKEAREAKRREERGQRGQGERAQGDRNQGDEQEDGGRRSRRSRRDRDDSRTEAPDEAGSEASGLEVVKPEADAKPRRRARSDADEASEPKPRRRAPAAQDEDASDDDAAPRRRRAPSRKRADAESAGSETEGVEAAE